MVSLEIIALVLTGLSITASIIYYTSILKNANNTQRQQLETRQSQLFMNIYNQSFCNPDFLKATKIVHQKKPDINSAEDFNKAYDYMNPNPEDPEFQDAWNYVSSVYEGLGVFVKEGLIDIKLIALTMTGMTLFTWDVISPFVKEIREHYGTLRWVSEWEYLVNELNQYIEEHPELQTVEGKEDTVFGLRT